MIRSNTCISPVVHAYYSKLHHRLLILLLSYIILPCSLLVNEYRIMDKSPDDNTHNTQAPTKKGTVSTIGETVACAYFSLFPSAPCPHWSYSGVANVVHGKFTPMLIQAIVSLV